MSIFTDYLQVIFVTNTLLIEASDIIIQIVGQGP